MDVPTWASVVALINAVIILAVLFAIFDTAKAAKETVSECAEIRARLERVSEAVKLIESHAKKVADNSARFGTTRSGE